MERKIASKFNIQEVYRTMNILNPYRFGGGAVISGHEPETLALMASIGWADDTTPSPHNGLTYAGVYNVLDTYFASGKSDGWLPLMKAVYLFIGDKAIDHKWNAINPQDTNAAFRMVWYGTGIHSASGWKGNGSNTKGDTFFIPSVNTTLDNEHLSLYSTTNNVPAQSDSIDMGAFSSGSQKSLLSLRGNATKDQFIAGINSDNIFSTNLDAKGLYLITKNGSTTVNKYKNGVNVDSGVSAGTLPLNSVYLGALHLGAGYGYTNQNYSYASMGDGMSAAQATAHYNAVQTLQTALGRQV